MRGKPKLTSVSLTDDERKTLKMRGITLRDAIRMGLDKPIYGNVDDPLKMESQEVHKEEILRHLAKFKTDYVESKEDFKKNVNPMRKHTILLNTYYKQLNHHAKILYCSMTELDDEAEDFIKSKELDKHDKTNVINTDRRKYKSPSRGTHRNNSKHKPKRNKKRKR